MASKSFRILVVDDNADAAESLAKILELGGHSVRFCTSSRDALAVAGQMRPQLAFVDIGMPEIDGFEVAAAIRRELPDSVKLVALSGYLHDPAMRARAGRAGFDANLLKPAEPALIEATIQELFTPRPPP